MSGRCEWSARVVRVSGPCEWSVRVVYPPLSDLRVASVDGPVEEGAEVGILLEQLPHRLLSQLLHLGQPRVEQGIQPEIQRVTRVV